MSSEPEQIPLPAAVQEIGGELVVHPGSAGKDVHLARWFVPVAIGLAMLFVLMRIDLPGLGAGELGFRVRLMLFLVLYLSLACTFFPLPTTPVVCWMATATLGLASLPNLARRIVTVILGGPLLVNVGLADDPMTRVWLIAGFGALGTTLANMNDYYLLTAILRSAGNNRSCWPA